MKEELVSLLVSKTGLDQQKAEQAVDAVLEYIKNNPQQFTSLLEKAGLGGVAASSAVCLTSKR
jgi:hypothetical protein